MHMKKQKTHKEEQAHELEEIAESSGSSHPMLTARQNQSSCSINPALIRRINAGLTIDLLLNSSRPVERIHGNGFLHSSYNNNNSSCSSNTVDRTSSGSSHEGDSVSVGSNHAISGLNGEIKAETCSEKCTLMSLLQQERMECGKVEPWRPVGSSTGVNQRLGTAKAREGGLKKPEKEIKRTSTEKEKVEEKKIEEKKKDEESDDEDEDDDEDDEDDDDDDDDEDDEDEDMLDSGSDDDDLGSDDVDEDESDDESDEEDQPKAGSKRPFSGPENASVGKKNKVGTPHPAAKQGGKKDVTSQTPTSVSKPQTPSVVTPKQPQQQQNQQQSGKNKKSPNQNGQQNRFSPNNSGKKFGQNQATQIDKIKIRGSRSAHRIKSPYRHRHSHAPNKRNEREIMQRIDRR